MLGGRIKLSAKEEAANNILMRLKLKEYDHCFQKPEQFLPRLHFFQAKEKIENSHVFRLIQTLPKGASLHSHDTALTSDEYVFSLTYRDSLYACLTSNNTSVGQLKFFHAPDSSCGGSNWKLVKDLRREVPNFHEVLKTSLTLKVSNPQQTYSDINKVWSAFQSLFSVITPMLTYRPVFQDHFYQALSELYLDQVTYMEFRGTLPPVYELNGTVYNEIEVAGLYYKVVKKFVKAHPGFQGVRFIYAPYRKVNNNTLKSYIKTAKLLKQTYPDFIAGFDLVGQEDLGRPLEDFVPLLHNMPNDINFFFHAGESNWYGAPTDFNLVDAVLLGTKRIGHGYALTKHPKVMQLVKQKGIGIEVCPISNQVLKLVDDIRNHPAAFLLAQNYPVVICNDDPSFWGSKGLSYDWYLAFMGMASRSADLRFLKQLAINSLTYSAIPAEEKPSVFGAWEKQWDRFVSSVINNMNEIVMGETGDYNIPVVEVLNL